MVPEARPLLMEPKVGFIPPAPWAYSYPSARDPSRRIPQAIAHRGYKAVLPENTMKAFISAIQIGAHAIETDLHLTKDGVVVLSHDGTLKRCFGIDKKINECDWDYLRTLRTLREPPEPMPRLVDLLEYLAQPGLEKIWLLLDVKRDDPPKKLLARVAETITSAPASRPWNQRITFGCWNHKYVNHCMEFLPTFPLAHIGYSISYARSFLSVPNIAFNMFQKGLVGPFGSRFLRQVKDANRLIFAWTVNDEEWMEWSIRKGMDGVITDDPKLFREVCARWDRPDEDGAKYRLRRPPPLRRIKLGLEVLVFQVLATILYAYMFVTGKFDYGTQIMSRNPNSLNV